jgi:hypothetical protein
MGMERGKKGIRGKEKVGDDDKNFNVPTPLFS